MGDHEQSSDRKIAAHYASVSEQQRLGPANLKTKSAPGSCSTATRHLHPRSRWTSAAPPVSTASRWPHAATRST